ncbi:MAG: helix-turn-helix domain-containing protein [Bacteroidetes bacterium]|nr:helix-turn-helix domain-containing protein [Bacteroidota bacterium]
MESLGEKIKRIRKSKGISQIVVAESCMIKQPSYANIESGKTQNITIEIGIGIAKALGVSFNELFEIEIGNLPKEEVNIQLEDLKVKLEELKERISEKDQLITAISNQNRQLKYEFLLMIYTDFQIEIDKMLIEIENSTDEDQKLKLTQKIEDWKVGLEDEVKHFITCGIIDKNDIKEFNEINIRKMKKETLPIYHKDIQLL